MSILRGWGHDLPRSYKVAARTRQRVRSSAIVPNQQEQTVMGTTADKIAGKIGSQLRSKIIDLSGLRAAKDIFEEAQLGADGLKNLPPRGNLWVVLGGCE